MDSSRETYDPGDEQTFEKFLAMVQSPRIQRVLRNVRMLLSMNRDTPAVQAYRQLEVLMDDYFADRLPIDQNDWITWEMIGRAYEVIVDRFAPRGMSGDERALTAEQTEAFHGACDRSIACFANACQSRRAKGVFGKSPFIKDRGRGR